MLQGTKSSKKSFFLPQWYIIFEGGQISLDPSVSQNIDTPLTLLRHIYSGQMRIAGFGCFSTWIANFSFLCKILMLSTLITGNEIGDERQAGRWGVGSRGGGEVGDVGRWHL